MSSHFKTFREAKKEYKARTGVEFGSGETLSGLTIYSRNRRRKGSRKLKKPYFVGHFIDWLNL